jgi:hypothetical protein
MKKLTFLAALAVAAIVFTGCTTTHQSKYSAPLTVKVETSVTPQVTVGELIKGEATIQRVLFIEWGASKFAECVNYGGTGVKGGFLFAPFEKGKAAAAYDACSKAKCDVIICPRYTIVNNDYVVYCKTNVKVEGYKGNFTKLKK